MLKSFLTLSALLVFLCSSNIAQAPLITLEEAIEIALKNDPSITRDQLGVQHKEKLEGSGAAMPFTQLFLAADEFKFGETSGIQSINAQQNFNLPKVSKAYNNYYQAQASQAKQQVRLTKKGLIKNVEQTYYQLFFAKSKYAVLKESQVIYDDFLARTKANMESGETGMVPVSSANIMVAKAQMELSHQQHEVHKAREIFNLWVGGHAGYDVINPESLTIPTVAQNATSNSAFFEILNAEKAIAIENVNVQKANMLPQINAGLRLQSVNGDLLYFGYQAGVNIPLFKKSQNKKIDAAKIEIKKQDAAILAKVKELDLRTAGLKNHITHVKEKINTLDQELIPAVEAQQKLMQGAYIEGEGTYMEYMMALENYAELRLMRVELMEEYFIELTELKFWTE